MDTPVKDTPPASEKEPVVEEKRYKEVQAAYTKSQQELKALKDKLEETEGLLNQVTPYVDWDAAQGKKGPSEDDDTPVTKAELKRQQAELEQRISGLTALQKFRMDNPDMVPYEHLVTAFLQQKTDPRSTPEKRLESATKMVRDFIESERKKGAEQSATAVKEQEAKEAETEGFDTGASPGEKAPEPDPTPDDYLAYRKKRLSQKRGQVVY